MKWNNYYLFSYPFTPCTKTHFSIPDKIYYVYYPYFLLLSFLIYVFVFYCSEEKYNGMDNKRLGMRIRIHIYTSTNLHIYIGII